MILSAFYKKMRKIDMRIGGITFSFDSEKELIIEPKLSAFCVDAKEKPEVKVQIHWNYDLAKKPASEMAGQDLIQNYYIEGDIKYCVTRGGHRGAVGIAVYSEDIKEIDCWINDRDFHQQIYTLGWIMRLLPMREIFQHYGIIFFHAAQIAVGTNGILFTGPSQTGKSTQAALWEKHEQAKLLCGDRTLLRKNDGLWKCFGYPIDGSSPVRSTEVTNLKAIVLLGQAEKNYIERLKGASAIAMLLPQLVIDTWSGEARQKGAEALSELLKDVPVYKLFCTPDKRAVDILKRQLIEDGMT